MSYPIAVEDALANECAIAIASPGHRERTIDAVVGLLGKNLAKRRCRRERRCGSRVDGDLAASTAGEDAA